MENSTGKKKLFVCKQKYGIRECLNDHKLFDISLKICILAKSNTFLELIKAELHVHQCALFARWP